MSHDDLLNRLNEVPALAGNEQQNATTLGELRAIKKLEVDRNLTRCIWFCHSLARASTPICASGCKSRRHSAEYPIDTKIDAHLAQAGTSVSPNVKT